MYSEMGWTDWDIAAAWMADVFIPATVSAAEDPSKPILLLMDGHDSHECQAIKAAIYNNQGDHKIILMCFPSKCTYQLQPLDKGVFCHTAQIWKAHVDYLTSTNVPVSRYNLVHEYMLIRNQFMTHDIITNTFKSSGIWPFNPDVFMEEDYTPSNAFSIKVHAPENFPCEVPSSDVAIMTDCASDSDSDLDDSDDSYQLLVSESEGPRCNTIYSGGELEGGVATMADDELDGSSKEGSAEMESIKPQDKRRWRRSKSDSEMEMDSESDANSDANSESQPSLPTMRSQS
jgi:DDE superfamily endonuclease